jgi:hypothetical protein
MCFACMHVVCRLYRLAHDVYSTGLHVVDNEALSPVGGRPNVLISPNLPLLYSLADHRIGSPDQCPQENHFTYLRGLAELDLQFPVPKLSAI